MNAAHCIVDISALSKAVCSLYHRQIQGAYNRHPEDALSREPVPAVVWMDYALFSVGRGRPTDAEESVRAADPLMVFYRVHLVLILLVTGRDMEAEQQLRQVLEIDQNSYVAWFFLGHVLLARGQPNDALASFQKAHALNPSTRTSGTLAGAFALTGDTASRTTRQTGACHRPRGPHGMGVVSPLARGSGSGRRLVWKSDRSEGS